MTQGVVQALFGMMREAMGFQLTNFQDCFSPVFRFIFGCLMKTCSTRDSVSFTAEEMASVERNWYSGVDAEVFKKLKTFRLTSRGLSCKANRPRQQALAELVVRTATRFARDGLVIEHLCLACDARTTEHRSAGRSAEG
jgi:hypothetical protein